MRKHLVLTAIFTVVLFCTKAQYVNIPDTNFRNYLQTNYPGCFNVSGQMDTTCSVLLTVDSLGFGGEMGSFCNYYQDMEGIQYFKNLKKFTLHNTCLVNCPLPPSVERIIASWQSSGFTLPANLKYLDVSYCGWLGNGMLPQSLEVLIAKNAGLASLPSLPASLKYLDVSTGEPGSPQNVLTQLPALPDGLTHLNCYGNLITALPSLPPALTYLNCTGNGYASPLTTLPTLPPLLETLECINPLSEMPPLPSSLTYLSCAGGTMTSLPVLPPALKTLIINRAPELSSLPALPGTITHMEVSSTKVASMPALPTALRTFIFRFDTMLTSLPAIPAGVEYIDCAFNRLTVFPALPASLTYFNCSGNRLSSLPAIPEGVTYLNAAVNSLTTLPPVPATLNWLDIHNNLLTALPAISNTSIFSLICGNNNLSSIPALPATLNGLYCNNNQITALPALPASLDTLFCSNNLLTSLPSITNTSLLGIVCSNNQLTELPALSPGLEYVECHNNNLYCLPRLPQPSCRLLIVTDTSKVRCLPNNQNEVYIQDYRSGAYWFSCWDGLSFGIVSLPLCNPTNNIGSCYAYPIMAGNIFYDNNSNNTKEANEPYKTNSKVVLHNGEFTFSDNNGYFELAATGLGANTITISPVRFFNCVPPAVNFNFTSYDTIAARTHALRANQVKDSMAISIVPVSWAARPGFGYACQVTWENIGTTTLDHTLTIGYDDTKLIYDSSSAPLTGSGNTLSLQTNASVPGSRQNIVVYFRLLPNAPLGALLTTRASVTANSISYSDSLSTFIGGSYDPNDKQATPQLSPSQVANGEFIDYTIRFQNTGTDTAFTVVITDTLSSDLQTGTLQMVTSSHNCKTTVKGNIVYFEFHNILLPDSNVNEPKSHGFVLFKIKPKTTVALNTVIPNKAAIYFDYNAPVITNTANTLIKIPDPVPLKLISFSAVPQNDNTVLLNWNTANEINTKYFKIERSNDGRSFTAVATVLAKGRENNYYHASVADANNGIVFYRLQMMDNDGTLSYSPIIKIDKRKNAVGFSVLTNPVNNFLIVNTTERSLHNTQASIINVQGAVVKTFIVKEGSQTIQVKELPKGIYYIRTATGNARFIIQ